MYNLEEEEEGKNQKCFLGIISLLYWIVFQMSGSSDASGIVSFFTEQEISLKVLLVCERLFLLGLINEQFGTLP